MPSALCIKAFQTKKGGREGLFRIHQLFALHQELALASSKTRIYFIEYSRQVRLMKTISPKASDSQSVTIELAVRQDGLKDIQCHKECIDQRYPIVLEKE